MLITLTALDDPRRIESAWRALEGEATCSFFQSWTWTGCLLRDRFPNPVLLQAHEGGSPVALALFNRRSSWLGSERLWLGASGIAELDSIFVEHNGVLLARGREGLLAACLQAVLERPIAPRRQWRRARSLILNGVDESHVRAARGLGWLRSYQSSLSPFVDLAAIRAARCSYLDTLSANGRYQIRRSIRRYATDGPLCIRRAESLEEAQSFLRALSELHQAAWIRRGKPGAFANERFVRFHRELLSRAFPRGEVDLLRIAAGSNIIGYLYNFRFRGNVAAYQSGFAYDFTDTHRKPGLTCHAIAIDMYLKESAQTYDFLAGDNRYKLSLANAQGRQYWIRIVSRAILR